MSGYSGTPLPEKLGVRPGHRLIVTGAPDGWVGSVLVVPPGVQVGDLRMRAADIVLAFCRSRRDLDRVLVAAWARPTTTGVL